MKCTNSVAGKEDNMKIPSAENFFIHGFMRYAIFVPAPKFVR